MSYSATSSIAAQLKTIKGIFDIYCTTNKGAAFICSDLVHLWKLLFDNSQGLKILIMFNGETIRGEFGIAAQMGRVDRQFVVVVSRGRCLTPNDPGKALVNDDFNAPPLFELVEEIRDVCRAIIFDANWTERPVDFSNVIPFPTEHTGRIVDAYQISFSVGTQLQLIVDQPDDQSAINQ